MPKYFEANEVVDIENDMRLIGQTMYAALMRTAQKIGNQTLAFEVSMRAFDENSDNLIPSNEALALLEATDPHAREQFVKEFMELRRGGYKPPQVLPVRSNELTKL